MDYYFAKEFSGPSFKIFYGPHLIALSVVVVFVLILLVLQWRKNKKWNNIFRWSLAIVLVLQEITYHLWNWYIGAWTLQKMLPFHICSAFVWLNALMLITKNRHIYDFAFFLGISGALQALLTPDIAQYGFPHYRFFHVFVSHGSIVLAALYMTIVEGYRPIRRSIGRVFLWLNVYAFFIFLINVFIGSNYLYVNHKPDTASLFDVLGPWPVYIFAAEVVALAMFLLLYSPFEIYDWQTQRRRADK